MSDTPKVPSPEIKEVEKMPLAARQLSAPYCDSYFLTTWPNIVRIAFGESLEGESYYRTAVIMPVEDAEDLAKSILDFVQRLREEKAAEKA
jgi:hypothetical protein